MKSLPIVATLIILSAIDCKSNLYSKQELALRLSPTAYYVTQSGGYERPYSGAFIKKNKKDGNYKCIICDKPLFKAKSQTYQNLPYVTFNKKLRNVVVKTKMSFDERKLYVVKCRNCNSYLGDYTDERLDVREDLTGMTWYLRLFLEIEQGRIFRFKKNRYNINSAAMWFEERDLEDD